MAPNPTFTLMTPTTSDGQKVAQIVQAQFAFAPDTTMRAAAATTIATVRALCGRTQAAAATASFHAHGLA